MLLAIDAGNSRVKWGLHDGDAWLQQDAVAGEAIDSLTEVWRHLPRPSKVLVANVAGAAAGERLRLALSALDLTPTWATSQPAACGVVNHYALPHQLGVDRWMALLATRRMVEGTAVIVNAGTAITVDALTADGHFLGGLILPGLRAMMQALAQRTDAVKVDSGVYQDFPTSTDNAVASAALVAASGAVRHMRERLAVAGQLASVVVLSGGAAADELERHIEAPVRRVRNLVLEGLLSLSCAS